MYKTEMTQGHREQICGFQGERGWKKNGLGGWVSRYKLLYMEYINNKVFLYRWENCIQYPVINHNEKKIFYKVYICYFIYSEYIYIYIYESIYYTAKIFIKKCWEMSLKKCSCIDVENSELSCTVGGNVNWCSHLKIVWRFLKKLKIELPYDPETPLLGVYLK